MNDIKTEEEYKKRFDEIIKKEKEEIDEYLKNESIKPQLDSPINKIYKKTGILLKQLQEEYHKNGK